MRRTVGIAGPLASADISNRLLDCEFALEPAFLALVSVAQAAGWQTTEIDLALVSLADNHMLGQMENLKTDKAIRQALRRLKE